MAVAKRSDSTVQKPRASRSTLTSRFLAARLLRHPISESMCLVDSPTSRLREGRKR